MTKEIPAAEGGIPVRGDYLPFARPSIGQSEIDLVVETLKSGWLTVGPRTKEFGRRVAEYVGVPKAVALSSCTAGLHLALDAFGVGPEDEVILPALDFASGVNTVLHLGARPVLVDIDRQTLNITTEIFERAITDRTKVLMPVHFAGRPCEMDGILELARARGLRVLGDGAHAIGADIGGRKIGSIADATSFSFYVTKGITTGEGGAIASPDPDLIAKVARLSLHGMSSDAWKRYSDRGPWYYEILEAGYKYNMNDVLAAIGLKQMDRVDDFRDRRTELARMYSDAFAGMPEIEAPLDYALGHHAWHLYPIQIRIESLTIDRDRFIRDLIEEGIGASVHFIPLHYHPYFRDRLGYGKGSFPETESYFERAISLPIYPSMADDDARDVVTAVAKLVDYYRR
jgi:dTDP-4-amino-4,6-dideoxygalactose transaminase